VRPWLLLHEIRLVGLVALAAPAAVPLALGIAAGPIVALGILPDKRQSWLGVGLEIAAPLVAALPVAWTVAREPALELQLSVRTPYPATVMRRLAITVVWSALLCFAIAGLLWAPGWWRLPNGFWLAQLTWLSPLLWLLAASATAVLVLHSPSATGGLIAVVWLLQIVAAGVFLSNRWLRDIHLFATTFAGPSAPFWRSNRLVLVALAALMLAAAWALLRRPESLLSGAEET
jgi:hypothetical protein